MRNKEKSITIHGISEELDQKIQERSRSLHLSQNKTVKKILEDSLTEKRKNREQKLKKFFGIWTKKEAEEFDRYIEEEFERIDEEDWK